MSEVSLAVQNPEAKRPGALIFADRVNDTYWRQISSTVGYCLACARSNLVVRAGYGVTSTPPIANNWGYGGFTYGFNGSVSHHCRHQPHRLCGRSQHLPAQSLPEPEGLAAEHRSEFGQLSGCVHHGSRRKSARLRAELQLYDAISAAR